MDMDEQRGWAIQQLVIKRSFIDRARGCLDKVASLSDCEQYEAHLLQARGILDRIVAEDRPHSFCHVGDR